MLRQVAICQAFTEAPVLGQSPLTGEPRKGPVLPVVGCGREVLHQGDHALHLVTPSRLQLLPEVLTGCVCMCVGAMGVLFLQWWWQMVSLVG